MYTIVADGVALFQSSDFEAVKAVYQLYKRLYAWAKVQVRKPRRAR